MLDTPLAGISQRLLYSVSKSRWWLTLRNLNGTGADPTDDITQQVFFHFVFGEPAEDGQASE